MVKLVKPIDDEHKYEAQKTVFVGAETKVVPIIKQHAKIKEKVLGERKWEQRNEEHTRRTLKRR